jgi:hypothetical protein
MYTKLGIHGGSGCLVNKSLSYYQTSTLNEEYAQESEREGRHLKSFF